MYEFLQYRVHHVMTRDVVVVDGSATVGEVQEIFTARDFNSLPVVESGSQLVGVVTKLDVLKAFVFTEISPIPHYDEIVARTIDEILTLKPWTAVPDEPLTRVLERIVRLRVKSFPVVTEGRLDGMVSREDVLRALDRAAGGKGPMP